MPGSTDAAAAPAGRRAKRYVDADKAGAYTWCKAPRYGGQVVETGALARQVVAGPSAGCAIWSRATAAASSPASSARMIELASVVPAMERWVRAIVPGEAFCAPAALPDAGRGRRPGRSGARQPRPLGDDPARPHRALPDHRADHLELLAARRRRPARPAGAGAGRPAGRRRLLIEWPDGEKEPIKYWLSTLPEDVAFRQLVDIAKLRWRIERDYQELKQEVGLGHFEGRGWRGFHHHATLCIAAYQFLISERETIPPSTDRATRVFPQFALCEGYQPRASAVAA